MNLLFNIITEANFIAGSIITTKVFSLGIDIITV